MTVVVDAALVEETVAAALSDERAWTEHWASLVAGGFHQSGIAPERGGAGGGLAETAAVVVGAGSVAATTPFVESTMVAAPLLAAAGLDGPVGDLMASGSVATVALTAPWRLERSAAGWLLSGSADRVPFGASADLLVVPVADDGRLRIAALPLAGARDQQLGCRPGANLAGEPRDGLDCTMAPLAPDQVSPPVDPALLASARDRAALGRALAVTGALRAVRAQTVGYAGQRQQFGRPLRSFPAVAGHLVEIEIWARGAEEACAAAVDAVGGSDADADAAAGSLAVAVARVWTSLAARDVARRAHQVHGAIGVTRELSLHRFTTRMVAWAAEHGTERDWAARVARLAPASNDWSRR